MSLFEFISVAVSIILGLGVTRLLSSLVELVRHHSRVELHWVPLTWALMILLLQFQFWWGLFSVSVSRSTWTNLNFLLVLLTTMALFAAGSLILPVRHAEGEINLWEHFRSEGRLGLGAMILFFLLFVPFGIVIQGIPLSWPPLWLGPAFSIGLLMVAIRSRTPLWVGASTVAYVGLFVLFVFTATTTVREAAP